MARRVNHSSNTNEQADGKATNLGPQRGATTITYDSNAIAFSLHLQVALYLHHSADELTSFFLLASSFLFKLTMSFHSLDINCLLGGSDTNQSLKTLFNTVLGNLASRLGFF
jgi:hypothetical protein